MLAPPASALANLLVVDRRSPDTFTLENGLQVIVLPSRRAPIVTQLLVYKVGSADEIFGKTGIAHFLEHMMFKGTASLAPGEFSRAVARNGGRDNAYTSFDATGYYQTIAADRLGLVMRMEADRMVHLRIADNELQPEREVVLEERRMRIDNVPGALLDESVRAALFGEHMPYGMPTAGYVEDVRTLSVDDLVGFYRRFYAPDNAVLIVAGDTSAEAVHELANIHYGSIPPRGIEPRLRPSQGPGNLPRAITRADVRVTQPTWSRDYLAPSYRVGERGHAYALQVLARLFGGTETSRLWRTLVVESKLALSAAAEYSPLSLGLSSFGVGVTARDVDAIAKIERAVDDQMKRVLDGEVTAGEVERTQNQLLAAAIYAQDSLGSGPRRYAAALTTGNDVADVEAWPQRIAAVSASDVIAAARHVWRDGGRVTSVLRPAGGVQ